MLEMFKLLNIERRCLIFKQNSGQLDVTWWWTTGIFKIPDFQNKGLYRSKDLSKDKFLGVLSHGSNKNLLTLKTMNFKYDRRLNNKQFLHVPGLCHAPFVSYLPKCSTQIYKAQYGDAIFVLLQGAQIWRLYITENIWNSIML